MTSKRTYLDSGVLIAAFQGTQEVSKAAMALLEDEGRYFIVSDFLRLETLPKPLFHKNQKEAAFMQAVLEGAQEEVKPNPVLTARAVELAARHDMTPVDALHVSAAIEAAADELVTTEKHGKPMFRVTEVRIVSLHPEKTP
jgi:predicted nucleic acid-binding protein